MLALPGCLGKVRLRWLGVCLGEDVVLRAAEAGQVGWGLWREREVVVWAGGKVRG